MNIASLPMYDWPALRVETNALWTSIRAALQSSGIDAPRDLDRARDNDDLWRDPAMVLSQTCAMPWRLGLHRKAALVGTPDYGVEGCAPGYYSSAIIVKKGCEKQTLQEYSNGICAFNAQNSQSGYAAMMQTVGGTSFFSEWHKTGAHAHSIEAVANGPADIAAIDAVTWRIAARALPAAKNVRVLMHTEPTPGLPYITSLKHDPALIAGAVNDAISTLDADVKAALGLRGLVALSNDDYL